jgi:hypothetical protein
MNGETPIAFGVGVQIPAPLIYFEAHRTQDEPSGVNACRQWPAQQRHARLLRRTIRLAMVILAAAGYKVLPGVLSTLRPGNNMIER